jgi:anaerobic ribonucleoside-triphosphate reductase
VGFTEDPFEALELQDELQCKYTGGTVLHLYMAERISSAQACKQLVRKALGRFRLPYIGDPDVLDLPGPRLPRRRTRVLPQVR